MSNPRRSRQRRQQRVQRRQLLIGAAAAAYAQAWRCPDCDSEPGQIWTDQHGVVHHEVHHDDSCPYLAGRTR